VTTRAVSFPISQRSNPQDPDSPLVDTGTVAVWFWCPGCDEPHAVNVGGNLDGPKWTWNGSLDLPTFRPSILVRGGASGFTCHSFVTDGRIQFLADCTHPKAGQTIDIPEPPDWLKR